MDHAFNIISELAWNYLHVTENIFAICAKLKIKNKEINRATNVEIIIMFNFKVSQKVSSKPVLEATVISKTIYCEI